MNETCLADDMQHDFLNKVLMIRWDERWQQSKELDWRALFSLEWHLWFCAAVRNPRAILLSNRQVSRLSWWDTQSTDKAQWCYFLWSPVTKQWGITSSSLNLECFAAINQMASLLTLTWSTLHWTVLCTFKELDNIQQPIRSPTRQCHSPLLRFLTLTVLYYGEMAGPTTFFFPAKNIWNSKTLFPPLRLFLLFQTAILIYFLI